MSERHPLSALLQECWEARGHGAAVGLPFLWLIGLFYGGLASAIVISITSVVLSALLLIFVWRKSIRWRILALLTGFLSLLFCFAAGHYALYVVNHFNYYFSQSIQEERFYQDFDAQFKKVLYANETLLYLAVVDDNLDRGLLAAKNMVTVDYARKDEFLTSDEGFYPLAKGYTIRFSTSTYERPMEHGQKITIRETVLQLRGKRGMRTFETNFDLPNHESLAVGKMAHATDRDQFLDGLVNLVGAVKDAREVESDRLEQLARGSSWTFADFCYFSTTTMTTVGYGDILPNSRPARLLTMLQCVVSVSYITFGLTLLWPSENSGTGSTSGSVVQKAAGEITDSRKQTSHLG